MNCPGAPSWQLFMILAHSLSSLLECVLPTGRAQGSPLHPWHLVLGRAVFVLSSLNQLLEMGQGDLPHSVFHKCPRSLYVSLLFPSSCKLVTGSQWESSRPRQELELGVAFILAKQQPAAPSQSWFRALCSVSGLLVPQGRLYLVSDNQCCPYL